MARRLKYNPMDNKQPTWIVNLAQGKNKTKQIGWLLRNVVEAK